MFVCFLSLLSFYFTIITHELGHLIFGKISGYKFLSFSAFPFTLQRENGKFRLKKFSLAGALGQCLMSPPKLKNNKIPTFLYNIGGIIVNIMFFIVFILVAIINNNYSFYLLSIITLFFIISNSIPIEDIITNDAANIIEINKNKNASKDLYSQLKLQEELINGKALKDVSNDIIYLPSYEDMRNFIISPIGLNYLSREIEQREFDKAANTADYLLNKDFSYVNLYKSLLKGERAFLYIIDKKFEKVDDFLDKNTIKVLKSMMSEPSILRILYSYNLLYKNDIKESEKIIKKFNS